MKKQHLLLYVIDVKSNDFIINIPFLVEQNNTFFFMKNIFNKDTRYSTCRLTLRYKIH